ncbi:arsenate reductase ArsC [Hydrogenivirga sp. 128-5-R1-1]|uniref:arsenate reductase ArsC n=1 Tax=Hydrogenivirga sp. 128-5-R1-1 TaxID=392423 RepID=UPI00015F36E4|nr:arsenate reductase ArsC [Hydrogenivirga sp. 128-5-R1-1]EDP76686.1 arsenate reductase [Hydrogenivirga sp. 128-5-R1-1]
MKIAFLCTGNSARSQIAEGFARHVSRQLGKDIEVFSAGSRPAGYVHRLAIKVMEEVGIDISSQRSKSLDDIPLDEVDLVVTLCDSAKRECPVPPGVRTEHWAIPDPAGRGLYGFRWVRDEIGRRVEELIESL